MNSKAREAIAERHMIRVYNWRAKKWGENYLKKNWWRIASMYDKDDISQEAFRMFIGVYRRHPGVLEPDLFRIYKCAMWGLVTTTGRQCFPNSYAYKDGVGKVVVELEEAPSHILQDNGLECIDEMRDLATKLPSELSAVLELIIKDFIGILYINQRGSKKISGKRRVEPLALALARMCKLDQSRDLLAELEEALNVQPLTKE